MTSSDGLKFFKINRYSELNTMDGSPKHAIFVFLYLFVAEILSLKIKSNNEIKGINISNIQDIKNIQHADDITVALKDINSLNIAITTAEDFCKHAGSKVKLSKTQCILLGCLKNKYTTLGGISVTNDAV